MEILSNKKEIEYRQHVTIYEEDLKEYGDGLMKLVKMYRKHIFVNDSDTEKILQQLEYYATQFKNRQYQNLIMNAHEIIKPDPDINHFPELEDSEYPF